MKRASQLVFWLGLGLAVVWVGWGLGVGGAERGIRHALPSSPMVLAVAPSAAHVAPAPSRTAAVPRVAPPHSEGTGEEALAAMRAQLEALERAQSGLAKELEKARVVATANAEMVAEATEPDDLDVELEEIPVAQRELAQAVLLDELHRDEPPCPKLRAEMSSRVSTFFAGADVAGSFVKAADCRSTLCRLEVGLDDVDARERLLNRISALLPPDAEGYAYVEDASDLDIQVYLSRSGVTLPAP